MDSANASVPPRDDTVTAGNGRLILALIAGIPVTVILAASWLWYFVVNGELDLVGALGTANRGELVKPPRALPEAGLIDAEGRPFALPELPKWVLVVPQRGTRCDDNCERLLYQTRQIHTALGKTMDRVRRMLVVDGDIGAMQLAVPALSDGHPLPEDFASYLAREQRGLSVWQGTPQSFDALFPEHAAAPDSWYLMDPAGWVMMRYDDEVSYKDVISDLKFLLKNSNG